MPQRTTTFPILCALLTALALAGCAKGPNQSRGLEQVHDSGPVEIRLKLDRAEATVADRLRLQLDAVSPEDAEVTFPEVGEKLGEFTAKREDSPAPLLLGGERTLRTRIYTLEPFLAGDYVIPPLSFSIRQGQEAGSVQTHEITVPVKSLFRVETPTEIHDIASPVQPPAGFGWVGWLLGLLLLAGAALWFWLKRRRIAARDVPPPLSAYDLAWRQLQDLVEENLPAQGEIKLYYQRLSGILRHYIENQFGLHAPGQTTEEFLRDLQRGDSLVQAHRSLLSDFLKHCDLVKFAEHQPSFADMNNALESCRDFIRARKEPDPAPRETPNPVAA